MCLCVLVCVCVHVKGLFKEKHTQTPPLAIISSFSYNNNTYDRIWLASNSGVEGLIARTRRVNIIRIKYTRCLYAEFTESRPGGWRGERGCQWSMGT